MKPRTQFTAYSFGNQTPANELLGLAGHHRASIASTPANVSRNGTFFATWLIIHQPLIIEPMEPLLACTDVEESGFGFAAVFVLATSRTVHLAL
jgi:hypothetical protein